MVGLYHDAVVIDGSEPTVTDEDLTILIRENRNMLLKTTVIGQEDYNWDTELK